LEISLDALFRDCKKPLSESHQIIEVELKLNKKLNLYSKFSHSFSEGLSSGSCANGFGVCCVCKFLIYLN
jgi:hypothetical protein